VLGAVRVSCRGRALDCIDCIGRQVQWVLPLPGRGQYMCEERSRSGAVVDGVSRIAGAGEDDDDY
jgi:hypothetical protein